MAFNSNSTTTEGVLQDYADYGIRNLQLQDRVPASMGTNAPLMDRPIKSADDVMSMFDDAFKRQRETQGGMATDTPYTPAGDAYASRRFDYLQAHEGNRTVAYMDTTGHATVGVGFNMDQGDGRAMWNDAFKANAEKPDFDLVRERKQGLTQPEVMQLTNYMADRFEHQINTQFAGVDLREHQRLALLDVAYQRPADLRPIAEAMKAGDTQRAAQLITSGPAYQVAKARRTRDAQLFLGA